MFFLFGSREHFVGRFKNGDYDDEGGEERGEMGRRSGAGGVHIV